MVRLIVQRDWDDKTTPINADRPSPVVATQGDSDPQWLKDLLRDGVSSALGLIRHLCRLVALLKAGTNLASLSSSKMS